MSPFKTRPTVSTQLSRERAARHVLQRVVLFRPAEPACDTSIWLPPHGMSLIKEDKGQSQQGRHAQKPNYPSSQGQYDAQAPQHQW